VEAQLKFQNPMVTAKGEERAFVKLETLKTLWFNTGSICNLSCKNCYIESSPKNDRLAFISEPEVSIYLQEITDLKMPVELIAFTGGEPFANPQILPIIEKTLSYGFETLVLTNAFKVIRKYKDDLTELNLKFGDKLKIRVSLDHYSREVHEAERGENTFDETLANLRWLTGAGFHTSIAARSLKKETAPDALTGYQKLFDENGISLKLSLNHNIVIFPEMDQKRDVPEITTKCWSILNKTPSEQMCSSERMIVKKKGSSSPTVMPCTLLAYDQQFELGDKLEHASKIVYLNHRFCAEFCVLGGASCSSTK
jgi:molybdenum cofactor biosynthesis enzyme MoaA